MRAPSKTLLIAALCVATAARAASAQVQARVLRPDDPGAPRSYWRDTLAQRVALRGGTLEVFAERDRANPNATTGRYAVRWNGLQVAVSDDSLGAGIVLVAAVVPGDPTVVVLSARTHLKVIVVEPVRAGGALAARAFSISVPQNAANDSLRVVAEPLNGSFALGTPAFILRYADGTLRLEPAGRAATGALVAGGESGYVAAMEAELRRLVVAEEAFFADSARYTDRLQSLKLRLAPGIRLMRLRLTAGGWGALVGSAGTRTVCAVFVGSVAAAPATREGEPACI